LFQAFFPADPPLFMRSNVFSDYLSVMVLAPHPTDFFEIWVAGFIELAVSFDLVNLGVHSTTSI
jgi:hypothetical protein